MLQIDLNADLGEGTDGVAPETDAALLRLVSSANIACGYHAGDAALMAHTVRAAHDRGVSMGAHPSYPDREGFGRRAMAATADEASAFVTDQVSALAEVCRTAGVRLRYVKPHGALYNAAARDAVLATAIVRGIAAVDPTLTLLALPNSAMIDAARAAGVRTAREGFADRGYRVDGTLIPRTEPNALITDPVAAAAHALRLAPTVDSLCVHSDTPGAVDIVNAVRDALVGAGYTIAPFVRDD